MTKTKLNKAQEKSLLLFLETIAVDQWGWIDDIRKLNQEDIKIAKRWDEEEFVLFKRASRDSHLGDARVEGKRIQLTYIVKLSDRAWKLAHKLRKEKALRHIPEQLT